MQHVKGKQLAAALLLMVAPLFGQVGVGSPAPSFSLAAFGGGTISLEDYRGKIVFINFFGST